MVILVMGVAGAGKTTLGSLLAARLGFSFFDADAFHPPSSVEKMRAGIPLEEEERGPWVEALSRAIDGWLAAGQNVVLACSALRAAYRRALLRGDETPLVYLRISPALAAERLEARTGHFAGPVLAASQFDALEEPEGAIVVDAFRAPEEAAEQVVRALGLG